MTKLRSINTHFWDDLYITDLEPLFKLLFLYLLSNPLVNIAGCYEIQLRKIVFDTGLDEETVRNGLERFEHDRKMYYRDGLLFIRNFLKNQKLNKNMKIGADRILEASPDWVRAIISNPSKSFETVSNGGVKYEVEVEVEVEGEGEAEIEPASPPAQEFQKPKAEEFGEPRDKIFSHPAILALRTVTKNIPPPETWPLLEAKLGNEVDLPLLTKCFAEWRAKGFKATNFDGIADWYLEAKNARDGPIQVSEPQMSDEEMAERLKQQVSKRPVPTFSM